MLLSKAVFNYTLINHPVLDEVPAQEALERVRQAVEEVWGPGSEAVQERLSPSAVRWRAVFRTEPTDTPEHREQRLDEVIRQLANNLWRDPASLEAVRALSHGQIQYSGLEQGKITWGLTISLQGKAPIVVTGTEAGSPHHASLQSHAKDMISVSQSIRPVAPPTENADTSGRRRIRRTR